MTTQHTSGPWTIDDTVGHYDIGIRAPNHGYVCFMGARGPNLSRNEQQHYNARLIAAAPKMHDLLSTIENDGKQVPAWLWEKIQEVLADVRGETE